MIGEMVLTNISFRFWIVTKGPIIRWMKSQQAQRTCPHAISSTCSVSTWKLLTRGVRSFHWRTHSSRTKIGKESKQSWRMDLEVLATRAELDALSTKSGTAAIVCVFKENIAHQVSLDMTNEQICDSETSLRNVCPPKMKSLFVSF